MLPGVGYGMMLVSAYVGIYYNVIIMYTIYYLVASFTLELPWVGCHNDWNTEFCSLLFDECTDPDVGGIVTEANECVRLNEMDDQTLAYYNVTKIPVPPYYNLSMYTDPLKDSRRRPSEEYWK